MIYQQRPLLRMRVIVPIQSPRQRQILNLLSLIFRWVN